MCHQLSFLPSVRVTSLGSAGKACALDACQEKVCRRQVHGRHQPADMCNAGFVGPRVDAARFCQPRRLVMFLAAGSPPKLLSLVLHLRLKLDNQAATTSVCC